MAFTQNFNSNTFGPVHWELMGPIADRPATADLHTTYLSTDEGDGVLKAYLYTGSGWMQMKGIEGFTGGGGGGGGAADYAKVTVTGNVEMASIIFTPTAVLADESVAYEATNQVESSGTEMDVLLFAGGYTQVMGILGYDVEEAEYMVDSMTTSGDVSYDADAQLLTVTGDGAIDVTWAENH